MEFFRWLDFQWKRFKDLLPFFKRREKENFIFDVFAYEKCTSYPEIKMGMNLTEDSH